MDVTGGKARGRVVRPASSGFVVSLGFAAVLMVIATPAQAGFVTDTLGTAGPSNYAILALNGAQDITLSGAGQTTGNVAVSSGTLSLNGSAGPEVKGNVLLAGGANISIGNPPQITGSVLTNQNLSPANTDAVNAASTFAALAPTQSLGAITGTTSINGAPGVNIIDITNLSLGNGQSLTLTGPAGAQFVINDSGGLTLTSGQINVSGGTTPTDVVLNIEGSGSNLLMPGTSNIEPVINAILLNPHGNITLSPALINGELIAGGPTIHLVSGASVTHPMTPTTVPEPSSLLLAATAGVLLLARAGHRRLHGCRNRKQSLFA
jgi:hypothetical protein